MGAMLKLFWQLIVIGLLCPFISLSQQVTKVIVSGWGEEHDEYVKTSFLIGYSSYDSTEYSGYIELYPFDILSSLQYAEENNIELIVRSQSDLYVGLYYAPLYPLRKLVMPSGSNQFVESFAGDVENSPIIITGAGIDSNVTGYQIDFFSIDPITENNLSSFANGFIAGQIAFIANKLDISVDSARTLARKFGSHNGTYNYYSGYGKILIENIIQYPTPVELSSFTAELINNSVQLNWVTQTELNNYGFEVQRKIRFNSYEESIWEPVVFIYGKGYSGFPNTYSYTDRGIQNGERITYRLKQIDLDGSYEYSEDVEIKLGPVEFKLFQNYPNPFNPGTNISFSLGEEGYILLKIYSITGEEVYTLLNEEMSAGIHSIDFNAGFLTSGVYIYTLDFYSKSGFSSSIRKMNLIR
jgi:hypothetical protein